MLADLKIIIKSLQRKLTRRNIPRTDNSYWDGLIVYESTGNYFNDDLCIFAHYDNKNKISARVLFYLNALFNENIDIVFVSTSNDLPQDELKKIEHIVSKIILRKNIGYDFGSWRTGYQCIQGINKYKNLFLVNDSIIGPVNSLSDMLHEMSARNYNLWGVTDNYEIEYHIQSYFLCFDNIVLKSNFLDEFMSRICVLKDKQSVINEYEVGLSRLAVEWGFEIGAYCGYDEILGYVNNTKHKYRDMLSEKCVNTTLWLPCVLLETFKSPFIKIELLRDNPNNIDLTDSFDYVRVNSNYPEEFINECIH